MAGETVITVVGNLVADPELRFTPSGAAVANFRIASTPRTFDRQTNEWKDGEALFLSCSVWREAAENVAESLTKGMRVDLQLHDGALLPLAGLVRALSQTALHDDAHALRQRLGHVLRGLAPDRAGEDQRLAVLPLVGLAVERARRGREAEVGDGSP